MKMFLHTLPKIIAGTTTEAVPTLETLHLMVKMYVPSTLRHSFLLQQPRHPGQRTHCVRRPYTCVVLYCFQSTSTHFKRGTWRTAPP